MYRVSHNIRKFSPTPIVRVTTGADGKEQEEMICISVLKKADGDKISQKIVELLNSEDHARNQI